jgi:hypothetical protein
MVRFALLAAAVLALAGSAQDSYTFRQRGTVAAPRAALHDGQPLDGRARIEGHAATVIGAERSPESTAPTSSSGAAVARKQAGGALRLKAGHAADFGLEIDSEWSPTSTTRDGVRVAAPEDHVVDVALAFRLSSKIGNPEDGMRLGWVVNVGGHSTPIVRGDSPIGDTDRDTTFLFRTAVVPSLRRGPVTFFGSLGMATESDVDASVLVTDSGDDPGVVADTSGAAFTLAAGARVDLGGGAHVTARVGDAFTSEDNGHYGPQVDVGLGVDFGD